MNLSGKYGKPYRRQKLQEALEDLFAEACLSGHCTKDAESIWSERAEELGALVKEVIEVYNIAVEWKAAGWERTYEVPVCVDSNGVRKGKTKEWQLIRKEEAAPQPLATKIEKCLNKREKHSKSWSRSNAVENLSDNPVDANLCLKCNEGTVHYDKRGWGKCDYCGNMVQRGERGWGQTFSSFEDALKRIEALKEAAKLRDAQEAAKTPIPKKVEKRVKIAQQVSAPTPPVAKPKTIAPTAAKPKAPLMEKELKKKVVEPPKLPMPREPSLEQKKRQELDAIYSRDFVSKVAGKAGFDEADAELGFSILGTVEKKDANSVNLAAYRRSFVAASLLMASQIRGRSGWVTGIADAAEVSGGSVTKRYRELWSGVAPLLGNAYLVHDYGAKLPPAPSDAEALFLRIGEEGRARLAESIRTGRVTAPAVDKPRVRS